MNELRDQIQVKPSSRPRGRLRWSLRALMALIGIFGIGLGWIINEAREQREAVEGIRRVGVTVSYDWELDRNFKAIPNGKPKAPAWLVRLLGINYFGHVVLVRVRWSKVDDSVMACIGRLSRLEKLVLYNVTMQDLYSPRATMCGGLVHLEELTRLRSLALSNIIVTDADLIHLKRLTRLQSLSLQKCEISGDGLEQLRGLTELILVDTDLDESTVENLRKTLPSGRFRYQLMSCPMYDLNF